MTLSIWGEGVANRCSQSVAFPLHRQIAHLWNRWRVVSDGGTPSRWPNLRPILDRVTTARSLQPPRVSVTRGTKETPTAWQEALCEAIFLSSPIDKAWPWVDAAPCRVSCCIVEITETSRAAGRPRSQLGRKISAGRDWEPGMRDGNSFLGAKAAVSAAEKKSITDGVVAMNAIPIASTPNVMIPKLISRQLAHRTLFTLSKER